MFPSSPQYTGGLSLTDELAEATNELLDLGGGDERIAASSGSNSIVPPLLTPSPLTLNSGGPTLSSILSINEDSKLVPIYDEEYSRPFSKSSTGKNKQTEGDCIDVEEEEITESFDKDDNLPSSRLNSLVASVSSTFKVEKLPSPRLRFDILTKSSQSDDNRPASFYCNDEMAPKASHTPSFFQESFPNARCIDGKSSSDQSETIKARRNAKDGKECIVSAMPMPVSGPARASLSNIGESSITVKLHGNRRLEREAALEKEKEQEDDEIVENLDNYSRQTDDGDRSSLLSLPATALTSSSQASSRYRRRLSRRQSAGSSHSIVTADVDLHLTEDTPFARDVQIGGFTTVGEKSRGFVCYDVRIVTIRGTTIRLLRRFSSFCQLRQKLLLERPQHAKLVPSLPPRRTGILHKYASKHLEKRRRELQKWLAIIMLDRRWATTKALREWVVGSSDET